jgi:hypothetical protein
MVQLQLLKLEVKTTKDRWIVKLNLRAHSEEIDYQHDEAWIGGLGYHLTL